MIALYLSGKLAGFETISVDQTLLLERTFITDDHMLSSLLQVSQLYADRTDAARTAQATPARLFQSAEDSFSGAKDQEVLDSRSSNAVLSAVKAMQGKIRVLEQEKQVQETTLKEACYSANIHGHLGVSHPLTLQIYEENTTLTILASRSASPAEKIAFARDF